MSEDEVMTILAEAKQLAQRYRTRTGKPLGITGEVAEFAAARLLGLALVEARQAGYDAIRIENGKPRRLQIKGRCLLPGHKRGQRISRIDIKKEFDGVLLVLMDECFNATAIYEADRQPVVDALTKSGSKSRNERGALSAWKFKSLGRRVWEKRDFPLAQMQLVNRAGRRVDSIAAECQQINTRFEQRRKMHAYLSDVAADIHFALRGFRRTPGLAVISPHARARDRRRLGASTWAATPASSGACCRSTAAH
jgi:hypothetical protein